MRWHTLVEKTEDNVSPQFSFTEDVMLLLILKLLYNNKFENKISWTKVKDLL